MERPSSAFGTFLAAAIALTLVLLGWLYQNQDLFPPNSLPWKPVILDASPNWLAHWQLNNLHQDRRACVVALEGAKALRITGQRDRKVGEGCVFETVVDMDSSPIVFAPHVTATCGLTAALAWYQKQLGPVAMAEMGSRLISIDQLGTFACRNVNNESNGRRSEHASANAIDVATFHFANGHSASVLKDYGRPTPEGRFLTAAHDKACGLFNTVLGPRYNRLHANHFHMDMGLYRICA